MPSRRFSNTLTVETSVVRWVVGMMKPARHRPPALPTILLGLALLPCTPTTTEAGSRTFFSPKLDGQPVAFCLTSTGGCGKAAADNFCRNSGFDAALTFARRQVMSDGGEEPTGFTQIKCY